MRLQANGEVLIKGEDGILLTADGKFDKALFDRVFGASDSTSLIFEERVRAQVSRTLLGYNPRTKFADGMAKTVEWYKTSYAPNLAADAKKAPVNALKRPVSTLNFRSECL